MKRKFKTIKYILRGSSHEKENMVVQDKIYFDKSSNFAGISLADGAGAYTFSHIGAKIATESAINILRKNYNNLFKKNVEEIKNILYSKIIKRLKEKSKKLNINIKELSSTLLFVFVKNNKYIAGHIGDGVIGVLESNRAVKVFSKPQNGDFANTTYFITSNNANSYFRIYKGNINEINGFVLMSDGAASLLYSKNKSEFGNAVNKIFKYIDNNQYIASERLKKLETYFKKRTDDDCSIIFLYMDK